MSNIGTRFKNLITEPKVTMNKIYNKFKRDRKSAWNLIFSEFYSDFKYYYTKSSKYLPIKYTGKHSFTIVSACYNVEKYLDDYFSSIVGQSLNFKKQIQIICVDDGSSDNTATIIKKWQKKYPNNISYIYQENKGQSSARNLGLESVKTEWVTFIDPDDFIDFSYFRLVDDILSKDSEIALLSSNVFYYLEEGDVVKHTHPLREKYKADRLINMSDMGDDIVISVASSIFKTSLINNNIRFNEELAFGFEDSLFCINYIEDNSGKVAFLKDAIYFFRKREDKSSLSDRAFRESEYYTLTLEKGYLSILESFNENNIPVYVQRTVLYHLVPYFKKYLNYTDGLYFLSESEHSILSDLLVRIFSLIELKQIWRFNLNGCSLLLRTAFIEFYKNELVPVYNSYIDSYDEKNKLLLLRFYSFLDREFVFYSQNNKSELIPLYHKIVNYEFQSKPIVYEHRFSIYIESTDELEIFVNGTNATIFLDFKKNVKYKNKISIKSLLTAKSLTQESAAWLIMDRDIQADDNGEHFYRYMLNEHKEQECYFALNETSHDWKRLQKEGFNLVGIGTPKFDELLKSANKIISSHSYATNYFGADSLERDFIFLQHGVTHNDQSAFFNGRSSLRGFITSTYDEFNAISGNNSHYKLSSREVFLTGMPRQDALLRNNRTDKKIILIMPTWRRSIVGNIVGQGLQRKKRDDFMETSYAMHWHSFLNDKRLAELAQKYSYEVIFAPHAEIEKYLDVFTLPDYIKIWRASDYSIQQLFQLSTFMITDYSSVAFDMAYIYKPTIYFQFDIEDFYGEHYRKDYYSYTEHGFGPVVYDKETLLNEVATILENDGVIASQYMDVIINTFPFRDGKNCERVYQAIKNIDEPIIPKINSNILREFIFSSYNRKNWDVLYCRCKTFREISDITKDTAIGSAYLFSLLKTYRFDKFLNLIKSISIDKDIKLQLQLEFAVLREEWNEIVNLLSMNDILDNSFKRLILMRSYAELKRNNELNVLIGKLDAVSFSEKIMIEVLTNLSENHWYGIIEILHENIKEFSTTELTFYKPELFLSRAYRMIGKYNKAIQVLSIYSKDNVNNLSYSLELAHLYFAKQNYKDVISQLDMISHNDIIFLPKESLKEYLLSLDYLGDVGKVSLLLKNISKDQRNIINITLPLLIERQEWDKIIELSEPIYKVNPELVSYPLILAKMRKGLFDEAYKLYIPTTSNSSYEYWDIIYEMALLNKDYSLAFDCLSNMMIMFPEYNREDTLRKLASLSR